MDLSYRIRLLRLIAKIVDPSWTRSNNFLPIDKRLIKDACLVARENKILAALYEGLSRLKLVSAIPPEMKALAERQLVRLSGYKKAVCEIAVMAEEKSLGFMVVKSIKPFTYVGDDVDLLVPFDKDYKQFTDGLKNIGYHCVGSGPPESAFRKRFRDFYVMVDVHRQMAASYIPYIDKKRVWTRRLRKKFGLCYVAVPSAYDEFLILSGHAVFKEFRINLADFMQAALLAKVIDIRRLRGVAQEEGVTLGLSFFVNLIRDLYCLLFRVELENGFHDENGLLGRLLVMLQKTRFKNGSVLPCYFHLSVPTFAYLDRGFNILCGRHKDRSLKFLLNFIRAPFTNIYGTRVLVKYLKESMLNFDTS